MARQYPPCMLLDPIAPFSPTPDNTVPSQSAHEEPSSSDPITFTPLSKRGPKGKTNLERPPDDEQPLNDFNSQPKEATVTETTKGPRTKVAQSKTKTSKPYMLRKGDSEPPIHTALRKSSTLPANDSTRICIDVTGDNEEVEHADLAQTSTERETQCSPAQAHFASLSPFVGASQKWFPAFDPTLVEALASKAQHIAMNCCHISSMNIALYILSKGPWVPTHISIHVRQAALAAVGVGWSWVNQVPTAFPFNQFDASVSLATLDDVPSNQVAQCEAVYILYTILCGNLSKSTRSFLFSKFEVQCHECSQQSQVPVDMFWATVAPDSITDDLCELLFLPGTMKKS